jgi:hypothetical protein
MIGTIFLRTFRGPDPEMAERILPLEMGRLT